MLTESELDYLAERISETVVRKMTVQTAVTPAHVAENFTLAERKAFWKERMKQQKAGKN